MCMCVFLTHINTIAVISVLQLLCLTPWFKFFHVHRCYCILHKENILGAIFDIWEELKTAESWEEVELAVWSELNNYKGFPL